MSHLHRRFFVRCGPVGNAAIPTVVADARHRVIDDRRVVHVVDNRDVYVVGRLVVEETPVIPTTAFIPMAAVSVSIGDATIEPDALTPVTLVEHVRIATPRPIPGGPQIPRLRRLDPRAGHPVIVAACPRPIAWRPQVAIARTRRLFVDRKVWGSNDDSVAGRYVLVWRRSPVRATGDECDRRRQQGNSQIRAVAHSECSY